MRMLGLWVIEQDIQISPAQSLWAAVDKNTIKKSLKSGCKTQNADAAW